MSSESFSSTLRRLFRLENRRATVRPGRIERIPHVSTTFDGSRDLTVYVPPGYDERDGRRYPVLYMHDGQNLFEPERAFIPGQHWRLSEAADEAIAARTASPMIIVGIDNGGVARGDEYTPVRDPKYNAGGRAGDHARMLLEEIKPLIDERFRTEPEKNGVGGSSLGGLLALHLVLRHSDVFDRAAVMSPSIWWADRAILREIDDYDRRARPRIWLDVGGREGVETLRNTRLVHERLLARGWTSRTLGYHEDRRGDHSERAWARRARPMLEFLFPPA
ncbi:MAG TPA: alpha/beta hydrolase-fold protein [Thermoanaerobaculia bacterium]|nr:alpha/beta hydrolase-fold protein [Thermoanaerobaculia bacterium]